MVMMRVVSVHVKFEASVRLDRLFQGGDGADPDGQISVF